MESKSQNKSNEYSTVLYFAFGSNLLSERMHINNPSAVKKINAKLKGYRLGFCGYADGWKGATATIIDDITNEIWGTVWQLPESSLDNLDRQEKGYKATQVTVQSSNGEEYLCRTYRIASEMKENKPSTVYKAVIVSGAVEQGLPTEYVAKLRCIEDNGHAGPVDIPVDVKKVLHALVVR